MQNNDSMFAASERNFPLAPDVPPGAFGRSIPGELSQKIALPAAHFQTSPAKFGSSPRVHIFKTNSAYITILIQAGCPRFLQRGTGSDGGAFSDGRGIVTSTFTRNVARPLRSHCSRAWRRFARPAPRKVDERVRPSLSLHSRFFRARAHERRGAAAQIGVKNFLTAASLGGVRAWRSARRPSPCGRSHRRCPARSR